MDGSSNRLQQLLDGEFDAEEIASDPVLTSLAERIYGLTIEPITPSKASAPIMGPSGEITEIAPPTSLMVEVVEGQAPSVLPPLHKEMPPLPEKKKRRLMFKLGLLSLFVSVANMAGLFGMVLGSICTEPIGSRGLCPTGGANRINWLDIQNIANGQGWSETYPFGIPDYALLAGSILLLLLFRRKK
jgi:hypothetical protein